MPMFPSSAVTAGQPMMPPPPSAPPGMMPQYAAQPYAAQPYAAQPYVSMVQPAVTAHPMQPAPTDKWEATPAAFMGLPSPPVDPFMGLPSPPIDQQHLIKDNAEPQGYPANSSAAVEIPLSPAQRIKGSRVSDPSGQIKTDQSHG